MFKLSRKDTSIVLFVWGMALFILSTSIYDLLLTSFSIGEVIRNVGLAFLLFGIGLTPQFFSKPISSAFKELDQLSPIFFTLKTRFYINNVGLSLLFLGWIVSFVLWLM
ncbi:hypothetical protein EIJ81_01320 (plasmid) [Aliivibrio salmonicida]|nr:hypothetical protein [Aliivibrio salmonicida]AZL83303.1 hypothetical protein EIJ81_00060 [Aliivibrio salmonicida]AZL83512.1 hypothetical protein EIJ81_01190 [Aliivibrio salmonicida]AZL83533.1 hypothetical protein EIJ81_01320 [Aliivibrio salmonicida]